MPIKLFILKRKKHLNWGYWNLGFVKLGVRWAERDINSENSEFLVSELVIWSGEQDVRFFFIILYTTNKTFF